MLKKVIGNLAFHFDFYSSKWNQSGKQVEIEAGFYIYNKKYGKEGINSVVASKMFRAWGRKWILVRYINTGKSGVNV